MTFFVPTLALTAAIAAAPPPAAAPKPAAATPPAAAPAASPAAAPMFSRRGVYYFDSGQKCPLAGVGKRGDNACNRVAIDDEFTTVTVDRAGKTITIHNAHSYPSEAIIADLTFLGPGTSKAGVVTPMAVHLKVHKKHDVAKGTLHLHAVTQDGFVSAVTDEFTVTVTGGAKPVEVLTPQLIRKVVSEPDLMARVANALVEVRDNIKPAQLAAWKSGEPLVDLDVGLGLGKAAKYVIKAELIPGNLWDHVPTARSLLKSGGWEIRLKALSSLLPKDVLQRDLFLFGVEDLKGLQSLKQNGIKKGMVLVFSMKDGKGLVGLDGALEPVEDALQMARAFAEFSFIGAVLMHQADQHSLKR